MLQGLTPLQLPDAAALARIALPADTPLLSARLEMLDGRAVLRIRQAIDMRQPIAQMRMIPEGYDLSTGQPIATVSPKDALSIGTAFGRRFGIAGAPGEARKTDIDQWTVQAFRGNQPLYRVVFADPAGSTIYVSGKSGEVVQQTTRFERFWGWLGAVPHWLYPTILRQDGALWSQVVIWTSLIGCFLTVTGLWVGLARLRRRRDGKIGSPYRGLWWWHHMFGLVVGLLTLSWAASGLLSMNPWGFLDSMAGFRESQVLAGDARWGAVRAALSKIGPMPADAVRIESTPLAGRTFLSVIKADGTITRFDAGGKAASITRDDLATALKPLAPLSSLDLLTHDDSYYYTHKYVMKLPVWRAVLSDAGQTRLYIDPASGQLIRAFDTNGRRFRWLQDGLHNLDFPILRIRPLWDLVVLPLLAAVTLVCATGTWMGIRKLRRDVRVLRRRRRRRRSKLPSGSAMPAGD